MAVNRNTYGLPDSTLQLIAGSPELSIPMMQQGSAAQFATPDVRRSDLISALRGIPGAANPGVTRYANAANGSALTPSSRKQLNVISPARLTMAKYVAPEVVLPGADVGGPGGSVVDDFDFKDFVVDDVVDDEIVDDGDKDVIDDPFVPVGTPIVDNTVVNDDTVEDDFVVDLDTSLLDDLVLPEEKEKTGKVDLEVVDGLEAQDDGTTEGILDLINAGLGGSEKTPTVDIEVVDTNDAQDDGTTQDILDLINSDYFNDMGYSVDGYPGGIPGYDGYEQYGGGFGGGGGGKPGDDNLWQILAM